MRTCAHCGSAAILDIVYGRPTAETMARAERREVWLGGCMVNADAPAYHCTSCQKDSGTNEALQALRQHARSPEEVAAALRGRERQKLEKEERRRIFKERARGK